MLLAVHAMIDISLISGNDDFMQDVGRGWCVWEGELTKSTHLTESTRQLTRLGDGGLASTPAVEMQEHRHDYILYTQLHNQVVNIPCKSIPKM